MGSEDSIDTEECDSELERCFGQLLFEGSDKWSSDEEIRPTRETSRPQQPSIGFRVEDEESIGGLEYLKPALDGNSDVVSGFEASYEESIKGFEYWKPALGEGVVSGLSPRDEKFSGTQLCRFEDGHRVIARAQVEHQILDDAFEFTDCAELNLGLEAGACAHMEMQVDPVEDQPIGQVDDSASGKL